MGHEKVDGLILQALVDQELLGHDVSALEVEEFLVKEGLVLDAVHIDRLLEKYRNGMIETKVSSASTMSDEVSVGSGDSEVSTADFLKLGPMEGANALETAREAVRSFFGGLNDPMAQRGQMLEFGDEIAMKAASYWVSTRSKHFPLSNRAGALWNGMDLCVNSKVTRESAKVFKIVPLAGHQEDNKPFVKYGQIVLLQSSGGFKRKVRMICPGRMGPIHYLDHVIIMEIGSSMSNRSTWSLGGTQRHGGVVPIFSKRERSEDVSPLCFTIHARDGMEETKEQVLGNEPKTPLPRSTLGVLVYNTWLIAPLYGVLPLLHGLGVGLAFRKGTRSRHIADGILSAFEAHGLDELPDVIVLCECFCARAGNRVKAGLKRKLGMLFETPIGGSGPVSETHALSNSGVTVISRYPILESECRVFYKEWARDDGLANKSFIYSRILKHGHVSHVVATHLQAWEYKQAILAREAQMLNMRRFVQSKSIPKEEPLLFAGDLNVCRVASPDQYERMLDILFAADPNDIHEEDMTRARNLIQLQRSKSNDLDDPEHHHEKVQRIFSFNSMKNTLAMGGPSAGDESALLDYVLYSRGHLKPTNGTATILSQTKSTKSYKWKKADHNDLSDHYPIYTRLEFEH